MRNFRILNPMAVLVLAFGTAGCMGTTDVSVAKSPPASNTIELAKAAISRPLKDPESLKIRNIAGYRTQLGDQIICGEYDAKNSFGGYTGYSTFYVRLRDRVVKSVHQDGDMQYIFLAAQACSKAAAGSIPLPAADVPTPI
jgi:hypothetical protein